MAHVLKPLAATAAAVGLTAWLGVAYQTPADPPPPDELACAAEPADDPPPKAAEPVAAPVKFAVNPKPLSEAVKKGLAYLAKNQQDDGGWNQGGGWRTAPAGGRVEGAKVEDPSDVGNTCIALLALVRAGNTATAGEYAANVRKGLAFVLGRIEAADADSLYVTDVKGTQLQSKIGPYVDTFLANLVLAELKGKAGEQEKKLVACLDKTVGKIVKHQGKDGQFAGNGGWAPVLSQGLANQALAKSRMAGVKVADVALDRVAAQSEAALKPAATTPATAAPAAVAFARSAGPVGGPVPAGAAGPAGGFGAPGDAGVPLYRISQGGRGGQDVVNALKPDADKAKKVIADATADAKAKEAAKETVRRFEEAEKQNAAAQAVLAAEVKSDRFVAGFGSNGGEEFLSFMNIGETLVMKGGKDWQDWDAKMQQVVPRAQDKDGGWSGHHCITGKTFCTAGALLVLLTDRTPAPAVPGGGLRPPSGESPCPASCFRLPGCSPPRSPRCWRSPPPGRRPRPLRPRWRNSTPPSPAASAT